jgi:hypothetical protein
MPQLDTRLKQNDMLLRLLNYGPAKSKKTWWVGKAAEAHFNILLLDGDNGWHILKHTKPEAQHRIRVINVMDDLNRVVFAPMITRLVKSGKMNWDEVERKVQFSANDNCIAIDLNKLGRFDILVIDSWTALVTSLMWQYAKENSIDLSEADKSDWDFYGWGGRMALWIASRLTALPCHLVVIAHATIYEKRSKDGKKIISQKRQIISTSGPNAMQMPAKFSDLLYFYMHKSAFKIDTKGTDEQDGGSRLIAPGVYNWDELQFIDLIKAAGMEAPTADNPNIDYSFAAAKTKPASNGVLNPTANKSAGLKLKLS